MAKADSTARNPYKYAFAGAQTNGGSIHIDNLETGVTFEYPIYDAKASEEIIDGMSSHDAVMVGMFIERNMRLRSKLIQQQLNENSLEAGHA